MRKLTKWPVCCLVFQTVECLPHPQTFLNMRTFGSSEFKWKLKEPIYIYLELKQNVPSLLPFIQFYDSKALSRCLYIRRCFPLQRGRWMSRPPGCFWQRWHQRHRRHRRHQAKLGDTQASGRKRLFLLCLRDHFVCLFWFTLGILYCINDFCMALLPGRFEFDGYLIQQDGRSPCSWALYQNTTYPKLCSTHVPL